MLERVLNNTKIYYTLLVLSFLVISIYAWRQAHVTDTQLHLQFKNTQQRNLNSQIQFWEKSILKRVDRIFERVAAKMNLSEDDLQLLERNVHNEMTFFDGIYIDTEPPYPQPIEIPNVNLSCATEDFYNCKIHSMELQQLISIALAESFIQSKRGQKAQEVLLNLGHSPLQKMNVDDMNSREIAWYLYKKILLIQAEMNNGNPVGSKNIYHGMLEELVLLPISYSISHQQSLSNIAQNKNYLNGAEYLWQRIQRKIQGYEQFFRNRNTVGDDYEIITDPYSATPYIIIQKNIDGIRIGIQLDPPVLLSFFLEEQDSETTPLIILDANSKPLPLHSQSGSSIEAKEIDQENIWFEIPLGSLFPHLRVSQLKPEEEAQIDKTSIIMPILFSGTLVFFAILGQIAAENRQKDFMERQRAFIARVTHELKTPLAGIRLMAESLQLGAITSPEQGKKFVERILLESDRLEMRIDEVLQVSKQAELRKQERISLKSLFQDMYREWQPRFKEIGGKLQLDIQSECFVMGDNNLLVDALNNLLSNALKYKKNDVELRCLIQVITKGKFIEIAVTDNGIGVPISHRKKIFERFVRVESDNRGFSGGHGLGLSFVWEAAQAHRGSIRCLDGFDGGSKFLLKIPKA